MNPAQWLARAARRWPDAPALMQGETVVADYAGFAARAGAVAAALRSRHGIGPGDRVAIFASNHTRYLETLYGIWWAGAVAVPINAKLHPAEAAWIIDHAQAGLVIAGDADAVSDRVAVPVIAMHGAVYEALIDAPPLAAPHPIDADRMVWLFYTSGTTGRPKGVMILARNLVAMALSYGADVDRVDQADAAFYAAPLSHGAGLYSLMHVMCGARHVVPRSGGFDPAEILDAAPRIGPLHMFAAPTMVRRLVDAAKAAGADGRGIKTIVYGGGPMYVADIEEAVAQMGPRFVQIYGQGECPMCITVLSRDEVADRSHPRWRERLGSVGRAQSVVSVAVLGPDGHAVDPGQIGEIVVKGDAVMGGYWQNPEATAKTIVDGWLHTGDMGALDPDGYLTLHDRSKDVIISGGTNIYPREVEEALLTHPAVHEVSVVGQTDPEWGEVVVAFVVGDTVTEAALDAYCLDRIARFKRPKRYRFVTALPKNNYGKVLKTALRDML